MTPIYTHLQGVTDNIYHFGRPVLLLQFFYLYPKQKCIVETQLKLN